MGVRDLVSFMERYSLTSKENIGVLAQNFRMSENTTPILLIDFPSCFGLIYNHAGLDKICGGQLKEFVNTFKQLLEMFEKFGIHCIFFCDCYPSPERQEIWLQRRKGKIDRANTTMSAIEAARDISQFRKVQNTFNQSSLPATGAWFSVMNYLRSINAQVIQTLREADQEIMSYCRRNKCFGVLAEDSDFVIAEEIPRYFSMKHLNLLTLDTVEYRRDKLAEHLALNADLLPILATLRGNDHIDFSTLRDFHVKLLRISEKTFIKSHVLFPKIAEWINMQSRYVDMIKHPETVAGMIKLPQLSSKFQASVDGYLSRADSPSLPVLSGNAVWDAIVRATDVKMRYQDQSSKIHGVVVSQVVFCSVYLQYFSNTLMYPSDERVGSKMRRRFYGILLNEHPRRDSVKVTEFVSATETGSQCVTPIFPGASEIHPGLLSMWSDRGNLEEKWKLLCWAVGEGVPLDLVRALPEPLQIPTLGLFYIRHESKLLQNWQASALALQAVLLLQATPTELENLQCICQDAVAVHLATVYQSLCMWVSYVSEACGNPTCFFEFKDYAFFDGKLFHSIYLSFKKNGNFFTYLSNLTTQETVWLKKMERIIGI